MISNYELHSRFTSLVPPSTRDMRVCVIGAGMVGSWTTLSLARMVAQVDVWDFDVVERENLGVQAYTQDYLGLNKAESLAGLGYGLPIVAHGERFGSNVFLGRATAVVSAVDTMKMRRVISDVASDYGCFFIDTRVLGETVCIETAKTRTEFDQYQLHLPKDDEVPNTPCGAKGTAFAGMWVASQVCSIINNINRGIKPPSKVVWHVGLNQQI